VATTTPSSLPVTESAVVQVLLNTLSHTQDFTRLYPSDHPPLQRQQSTETVESFSGEDGRFRFLNRMAISLADARPMCWDKTDRQ
jgi:hypothetical protein